VKGDTSRVQTSARPESLRARRERLRREDDARARMRELLAAAFQDAAESRYVLDSAPAIGNSTALYSYALGALCAQVGLDDAVITKALARVKERAEQRAAAGGAP
jgi:hypothetical protein